MSSRARSRRACPERGLRNPEPSHLYEAKIRNMGNGGEYYTLRPLIRAIVQVVRPRVGDRIYVLSKKKKASAAEQ